MENAKTEEMQKVVNMTIPKQFDKLSQHKIFLSVMHNETDYYILYCKIRKFY